MYKRCVAIIILIAICVFPMALFGQDEDPIYYQNIIGSIVNSFDEKYMDEDEANDMASDAGTLVDKIEEELENAQLTSVQRAEYKKVLAYSKDVENALNCVCYSSFMCEDKLSFMRGAAILGLSVSSVFNGKFCVDFLKIEYKDFVSYQAENKSFGTAQLVVKWSANNGMNTGSSQCAVFSNSIRSVFDNRDNPEVKSIYFTIVKCNGQ